MDLFDGFLKYYKNIDDFIDDKDDKHDKHDKDDKRKKDDKDDKHTKDDKDDKRKKDDKDDKRKKDDRDDKHKKDDKDKKDKKKKNFKNLVFMMRHGDTFKDQTLDYKKYEKQANNNVKNISKMTNFVKNDDSQKFIIHCSPYLRCIETAKLLKKKIKEYDSDVEIIIKKDDNLSRWDKGREPRENSYVRARAYGKEIKKYLVNNDKNYCYFFITHSSILFYLIEGLLNKEINKNKKIKSGAFYVVDHVKNDIVFQDIYS